MELVEVYTRSWTLIGNKGGYVAQHEQTILVIDKTPVILKDSNEVWN